MKHRRIVLSIAKNIPITADTILVSIIQCTINQVIKQALHITLVCCINICIHGTSIAIARNNIRPYIHWQSCCTSQRTMVFPMPVLKLYIVDMKAIERIDHCHNLLLTQVSVCRQESVTHKFLRRRGHIHSDRSIHPRTLIHIYQITLVVLRGRLPCPLCCGQCMLIQRLA